MDEKEQRKISAEEHRNQVQAYENELSIYKIYADVLKRLLESACSVAIPQAFIQSRAKTVSSFAEKCVRRHDRYPDAVNQMTDLCGVLKIIGISF